ncbi:uncharacterized protein LOC132306730 [Cornus florida]|uniref:uncharacterized protein LOC132306730 n=1 Tax=Cornus florida TaxID=4283 RepID=UPI002899F798|nr:uncharacterized protein LOC132306730 [Cornus florida]
MASRKRSISNGSDIHALHKEWDEASCPICMDHPHNAVLLKCSSHAKGCRSYICDTSYRHSNCLDRFKKLRADNRNSLLTPNLLPSNQQSSIDISDSGSLGLRTTSALIEANGDHNLRENHTVASVGLPGGTGESGIDDADRRLEMQEGMFETRNSESSLGRLELEENNGESLPDSRLSLRCPLCRGTVLGYEIVEEARKYLNLKPRSCSRESCSFSGNYRELCRHARRAHPTARPADIDQSRLRSWRRLEHQREYGDLVSAIRSAMPGAVVLGDYVIENGDRPPGERERGSGEANGPWWTTFFLFQMIGSMDSAAERRGSRSRAWTRHRRSTGALSGRRFLWGENLLGLQDDDDDDEDDDDLDLNILSDMGEDVSPIPRRRRRLTRSRSDEDES